MSKCELCSFTALRRVGGASYCTSCADKVLLDLLADAGAIIRDLELGYPKQELHADPAAVVDEIAETLEDLGHTSKEEFLG